MDADGAQPARGLHRTGTSARAEPAWTADGQLHRGAADRRAARRRAARRRASGCISKDGGDGVELIGRDVRGASWPSLERDGRYVYFQ